MGDPEVAKRLEEIKKHTALTDKELGAIIGVSDDSFRYYRIGESELKKPRARKLAEYLGIDPNWILVGIGRGIDDLSGLNSFDKVGASEQQPPAYDRVKAQERVAPLLMEVANLFDSTHRYKICDVEGSSMEPTLHSGDLLLCRWMKPEDVGNGHNGNPDARIYVVFTDRADLKRAHPSGKWVKRITYNKDTNRFTCRSDNVDSIESFATFQLDRSEVIDIWYPVLRLTWNLANPHRNLYSRIEDLESRVELLEDLNQ